VVAIQDVCPHRGARLSEGDCHYRGTVACPYHGWVYDEGGKNVAVLSEGPDSGVCGKPGTEAKAYPTRTLKGVVFVWIGEQDPAPIEEDVPEEFFDPEALVLTGQVYWRCNWEVALENSMDSHVNYVHRNALVVARAGFIARGAQGEHPIFVGNGFGGDVAESNYMRRSPLQDLYPSGRKWPKTTYRRYWTWLLRPLVERARGNIPPPRSARWCGGHHLPGMFRAEFAYDLYTRMCVPVEEKLTRVWYYHYLRPKSAAARLWQRVLYAALHRWIIEYNFSRQDERVMLNQRYDTPEKLSGTDAEVIQWRRLVVTKHTGGRDAPFEYHNPGGMAPDAVPLNRVSVRYLQEEQRAKARA
jgi:phenylpropionate dioxygenase-like ring-hydroxylating dioxygenase large terminal subunit